MALACRVKRKTPAKGNDWGGRMASFDSGTNMLLVDLERRVAPFAATVYEATRAIAVGAAASCAGSRTEAPGESQYTAETAPNSLKTGPVVRRGPGEPGRLKGRPLLRT